MDDKRAVLLALLDLTAAFNTVEHNIIINMSRICVWHHWHCTQTVQVISVRKISKGKHCWSDVTQLPFRLLCSPMISIRTNDVFSVY